MSRSISPAISLEKVLYEALSAMRRLVSFRGGSISLVEDGHLHVAYSDPPVSAEVAAIRLPLGEGLTGRAVAEGEPVYSPDLDRDPRVDPELRSLGSNRGIASYLVVPLITLGEVIGAFQVDSPEPDAFDDIDRVLLSGLAAQVAGVIESARRFEAKAATDELRRDIIGMLSHELRTPLTIVRGMIETILIQRDQLEDAQVDELLQRADRSALRLSGLIEELLLVSQLHEEDVVPEAHDLDLRELVDHVAHTCRSPGRVRVEGVDSRTVSTDRRLLDRALAALVDNGLVHGRTEVTVTVDASGVRIVDGGPGIPANVLETEDEFFVRGSAVPTDVAGLGLGIPLARTLLRLVDAELEFVTSPAGGTTAIVRIPDAISAGGVAT